MCSSDLESSDCVPDKTRSQLITKVLNEIADIAKELTDASLLEDLEKVIPIFNINVEYIDLYVQCVQTWFSNYASANSKEGKAAKDTPGVIFICHFMACVDVFTKFHDSGRLHNLHAAGHGSSAVHKCGQYHQSRFLTGPLCVAGT